MQRWSPPPFFQEESVFLIGGGYSLRGNPEKGIAPFDWSRLKGKNTIGCNSAFIHGPAICQFCFFSDKAWFERFYPELDEYVKAGGVVVTHDPDLRHSNVPWLKFMEREEYGLHRYALGYGGNSGASAVNLALIMGAARVYLLGFDCKLSQPDKPNWHDRVIDTPDAQVYVRFMEGFQRLKEALPLTFPDRQIINLGPDSAIPYFPFATINSVLP